MRKRPVQNVVVHIADNTDFYTLFGKVGKFHTDLIERRLKQSDLTTEQKIAVIDKILEILKSRELDGIIK